MEFLLEEVERERRVLPPLPQSIAAPPPNEASLLLDLQKTSPVQPPEKIYISYGRIYSERKNRFMLPPNSQRILKEWIIRNAKDPYPSQDQRVHLMKLTEMSLVQINNWFANARRRILQRGTPRKKNCFRRTEIPAMEGFTSPTEVEKQLATLYKELNSIESEISTRKTENFPKIFNANLAMTQPNAIVTADICDAHESNVGKSFWVVDPSLRFQSYGGKSSFGGEIVTVKVYEDNVKVKAILTERDGTGKVLVVDGGGSYRCALVGDLIAAGAAEKKWEGVLVFGCIRDSKEISQIPIHIKALGTNPLRSIKKNQGEVDIPVTFGGVTFVPGQFIYGDEDGIVVSSTKVASKL